MQPTEPRVQELSADNVSTPSPAVNTESSVEKEGTNMKYVWITGFICLWMCSIVYLFIN